MRRFIASSALILLTSLPLSAAEDLSRFGTPVDQVTGAPLKPARGDWPATVCAEVQRMERLVVEDARPTDRANLRIGLLFLQKAHCGIDIEAKLSADQRVLENEQRKAARDYQINMEAAERSAAASRPAPTIVIQAPQAGSSLPDPAPSVNCTTTRLGGGMSTTNCR